MFDIGWSELLVVAVVAIVVIGPKDLPGALRTFGRWAGKAKKMARDFQGQFSEALREAELDDIKNLHKEVTNTLRDVDPTALMKKEAGKIDADLRSAIGKPVADPELGKLAADSGTAEPAPVIAGENKP